MARLKALLYIIFISLFIFSSCNENLGTVTSSSGEISEVSIISLTPSKGLAVGSGDTIYAEIAYKIAPEYYYTDENYEIVIYFKDLNGDYTSIKTGSESVNVFNSEGRTVISFPLKDILDLNIVGAPITFHFTLAANVSGKRYGLAASDDAGFYKLKN